MHRTLDPSKLHELLRLEGNGRSGSNIHTVAQDLAIYSFLDSDRCHDTRRSPALEFGNSGRCPFEFSAVSSSGFEPSELPSEGRIVTRCTGDLGETWSPLGSSPRVLLRFIGNFTRLGWSSACRSAIYLYAAISDSGFPSQARVTYGSAALAHRADSCFSAGPFCLTTQRRCH